MDYSRNSKFKAGLFLIALMTMTACSSSQVDDGSAPPPETAGDAQAPLDASTDAVPPAADAGAPPVGEDPSLAAQPAPGALDAAQPPGDPAAVASAPPGDPSAIADAPPMGDPSALAPAPIADIPPPAPLTDPVASAPAPAAPEAQASAPVADASSAPSGDGVSYKVKRGDTLMKIAFENYGDLYRWKEIFEANRAKITDPNAVPPGTQLTLNGAGMVQIERNGERYLIKRGDTLGLISNDVYGTPKKWKKLWENNRQLIKNPNHIYAGFYLFYQPEARLTHEEEAPAVIDGGGSAQNLPFKGQGQPAQNVAEVQPAAMQNAAPVNPAAPSDQRQPASNK